VSNQYTESNYPPGWQRVQYRWDVAWALIRAIDNERTLAAAGLLLPLTHDTVDLATVARRDWRRVWDRDCRG
jgi:hypothetical protein